MNLVSWSALVGFLAPALISIVNREPWSPMVKSLVALGTSALAGTVTALLSGDFSGATWLEAVGAAFAASQAFYHVWWKNSGITDWLEQRVNVFGGSQLLGGSSGGSTSGG